MAFLIAALKTVGHSEPTEIYQQQALETAAAYSGSEEAESATESEEDPLALTVADENMLMQIAMAEAESEGTEGKALVILVVLNRVESEEFPDTIEEVIFQPGQFSPVGDGRYYDVAPDEECREALAMVEGGWDESQGALYFESCEGESWQSRNLELLFAFGRHRFYREAKV